MYGINLKQLKQLTEENNRLKIQMQNNEDFHSFTNEFRNYVDRYVDKAISDNYITLKELKAIDDYAAFVLKLHPNWNRDMLRQFLDQPDTIKMAKLKQAIANKIHPDKFSHNPQKQAEAVKIFKVLNNCLEQMEQYQEKYIKKKNESR